MERSATDRHGSHLIVGIGGSTRVSSLTDRLLRYALDRATAGGARTVHFDGPFLATLPVFSLDTATSAPVDLLVRTVAAADGLVVASPGYHGGVSGLVKNGLDHLEALSEDARPYLHGRAVGLIVTAAGWQAVGTTLVSLRSTVHALRGWPTPFAVTVNSARPVYDDAGRLDEQVAAALRLVADQVVDFAAGRAAGPPQ
jgi:FMN reductase